MIDERKIGFGQGVQTYKRGFLSPLITAIIGGEYSHDAPFIWYDEKWWLGHEKGTIGKLQSIDSFNEDVAKGKIKRYRVIQIKNLSKLDGIKANEWWLNNVHGRVYDYAGAIKAGLENARGIPKLIFKYLLGWLSKRIKQWEWAWYCTENLRVMFMKATNGEVDPWNKDHPTPRTTDKRVDQGLIEDITDSVGL